MTAPAQTAPRVRNPNRDLGADAVVSLFRRRLPAAMLNGLTADREWLWWSGDKPDEATRTILNEIGFDFTPRKHSVTLRDNSEGVAHWFHACGTYVKRTGRGGCSPAKGEATKTAAKPDSSPARSADRRAPSRVTAPRVQRHDSPTAGVAIESDAAARFLRLTESIA